MEKQQPYTYLPIFRTALLALFLALFLVQGCGGGGGSAGGGQTLPTKTLSWEAPALYSDSTPLDPATDLDSFEIYLTQDGKFHSGTPNAALAAYNPGTNQVTTSFNLSNLSPYITKGVEYHVAVRAVAKNGSKSDFSPSAVFSY